MKTKQILFFDFFGTLVEYVRNRDYIAYPETVGFLGSTVEMTTKQFLELWNRAFRETEARHLDLREFRLTAVAQSFEKMLGAKIDIEQLVSIYMQEWGKGISYIPGIPGMLSDLATRYRLAVISNTHYPEIVHRHLELAGIRSFFESVHTSAEFGFRKPSAAIFEHALRTANIGAEGALHIGDSYEDDFLGAQNALIDCVLISDSQRSDVKMQIQSIISLPEVLAEP